MANKKLLNKLKKDKDLAKIEVNENDLIDTYINLNVVSLNLVFSGKIDGGLAKGKMSAIAADSQLGKSMIGYNLLQAAYRGGMTCIVIDTERAFNVDVVKQLGIDLDDIIVYRTSDIPKVKEIFAQTVDGLTRDEAKEVFVLLDSWGGLVPLQIMEKAAKGVGTADMGTTARFKNELANIINACGLSTWVINHVSASMAAFGEPLDVPGGRRLFFLAESIGLCTSAAKYKDANGNILGKVITIGVKKGRGSKEFLKTKYLIRHDGGLDPFFGLLDEALESGCVFKPKPGFYARIDYDVNKETGEVEKMWKESELYCGKFWVPLYRDENFKTYIEKHFSFDNSKLIAAQHNVMDMINGKEELTDEILPGGDAEGDEGEEE